jgi:hypothetical protein
MGFRAMRRPTRIMQTKRIWVSILACCVALFSFEAQAVEDIEFVAEHLPEVSMDNRYATLPVWSTNTEQPRGFLAQAAYSSVTTGELRISGPLLSVGYIRGINSEWSVGATLFVDRLQLSGNNDLRPLQTLFAPDTPLVRPAPARFDHLDGTMDHVGSAFTVARLSSGGWLGIHRWLAGVVIEQIKLADYSFDYEILEGPDAGVRGTIDFDTTYRHVTPILGLNVPRHVGLWSYDTTALLAWPIPRRGFVGHITGPGFDLHGDTADVGNGKHFGDPSLTLGFDVTYEPAHITFGLGTLVTQRLLEPHIHRGIETDWLLNVSVSY